MDNDNLQKIDDIIKRTNTDYSTAKQALDDANGDVLEAIILIESKNKNQQHAKSASGKGEQIFNQLKDILTKGNATKITIKKNNDVIVNLPITAGIIGAWIAPFLSAAGITAALLTQCSVEITQADGKIVDLGQKFDDGIDAVKDAMHGMKQGASNLKDDIMQNTNEMKKDFKQNATEMKDDIADTLNKKDDIF